MNVLEALRKAYKQEMREDGYIDATLARKIMDALVAYTDEAELEDSTPAEDLRQWASILNAAANLLENKNAERLEIVEVTSEYLGADRE